MTTKIALSVSSIVGFLVVISSIGVSLCVVQTSNSEVNCSIYNASEPCPPGNIDIFCLSNGSSVNGVCLARELVCDTANNVSLADTFDTCRTDSGNNNTNNGNNTNNNTDSSNSTDTNGGTDTDDDNAATHVACHLITTTILFALTIQAIFP